MFCIRHLMHARSIGSLLLLLVSASSAAQDAVLARGSSACQVAEATLQDAETIKAMSTDGQLLCRWQAAAMT
jgi:ABC-type protease/lipase transport system fused ATPase/permease subunit